MDLCSGSLRKVPAVGNAAPAPCSSRLVHRLAGGCGHAGPRDRAMNSTRAPASWSSHGSYSPWLSPPCSFHFVFSLSHRSCPILVWRAFESCQTLCQCLFAASTDTSFRKSLASTRALHSVTVTGPTRHCDQWQNCHPLQPATSTWVGTEVVAFGAPPADTLNALSLSRVCGAENYRKQPFVGNYAERFQDICEPLHSVAMLPPGTADGHTARAPQHRGHSLYLQRERRFLLPLGDSPRLKGTELRSLDELSYSKHAFGSIFQSSDLQVGRKG